MNLKYNFFYSILLDIEMTIKNASIEIIICKDMEETLLRKKAFSTFSTSGGHFSSKPVEFATLPGHQNKFLPCCTR
ncbi:hypothetical protein [Legionella bozemanae]|uniref:Uncharacterized protein n=1 Tax=Legionella bozemanae TaxID=447 RepID=A0A0W0R6P1_LEGBO|nr:hypothetical protein [Legionella bozemanae]KTC66737.1 hypothetical protein Lboz_3632 [Legionella bozemanae]STO34647.1 Uncharacterised protein [Legionella bozemanae]